MIRHARHAACALPILTLLGAAGCTVDGPSVPSPAAGDDAGGGSRVIEGAAIEGTATEGEATMTDANAPVARSTGTAARGEAEASPDTLLVSVRAAAPRSVVGGPLELVVEARNATAEGATLLLWNTPFERTLSADVFHVSRDGEPVVYRGRLVKRALPPGEDALVRLAPGETFERTLDLSRAYAFDEPGTYSIEFMPRPAVLDDGTGYAALVAADEDPVVIERR